MRNPKMVFSTALLLLLSSAVLACDKGGDAGAKTSGSGAPSGDADKKGTGNQSKVIGTWLAADNSGETLEITSDKMTTTYPKAGGKPVVAAYKVKKDEGNRLVVSALIDLGGGKTFPGDDQTLTLLDADTLEMKNATNGSGNKFKRKK